MSTIQTTETPAADLSGAAAALIRDIEEYLAAQTPKTAHPLVTKTTEQLVAEALSTPGASAETDPAPALAPPSRLLRLLPDWVLSVPMLRQLHGGGRRISVAEHLQLTALVIERYGWQSGAVRSRSGRRCILGAQAVLHRLGYGDEPTARAAGARIQTVLGARGFTGSIDTWNDAEGRTEAEVLCLLREAAAA